MQITSLSNAKVKQWFKYHEKKHRDKDQRFLIEGEHLLQEAHRAGIIECIIPQKLSVPVLNSHKMRTKFPFITPVIEYDSGICILHRLVKLPLSDREFNLKTTLFEINSRAEEKGSYITVDYRHLALVIADQLLRFRMIPYQ